MILSIEDFHSKVGKFLIEKKVLEVLHQFNRSFSSFIIAVSLILPNDRPFIFVLLRPISLLRQVSSEFIPFTF